MKILAPKSYVYQYKILYDIAIYDEKVIYRAEDYKLDKEVILCECDISYKDIYQKILGYENPSLPRVTSIVEENDKIYFVSKIAKGVQFDQYLTSSTQNFSENEINIIANSLIELMIQLKDKELCVLLNTDNLLIDDKKIILHDISNIEKYKTDSQMIFELGRIMYMLSTKSVYNDGDILKVSSDFSVAQTSLINRMLSNEKLFKSLNEIQVLLKGSIRKSEDSCEPIVCNEKRNHISSFIFTSLAVIVLSISVIYVYNSKKVIDVKDVNLLNSIQFHISAYMGKDDAKYNLAKMYENGYGVDRDIDKALSYYKEVAKKGNLNAQLHLAKIYNNGTNVNKDIDKAISWYKLASKQNSAYSQYSIGRIYYDKKDYKKAIYWIELAANKEYKYAYNMLGYLYLNADEDKDYKKAFKWFNRGLDVDKPYAQMVIGYMYEKGYGVKKDLKKALDLYNKSAKTGYVIAQTNLAYMYEHGMGTIKDIKKAKYWYSKAAKQGDEYAIKALKRFND